MLRNIHVWGLLLWSNFSNTPKYRHLNTESRFLQSRISPGSCYLFASFLRLNCAREWFRIKNTGSVLGNALAWKLKCHWSGRGEKWHNFIFSEWKDNHLIYEPHSKGLLMKDLLVSTRPSYQHLHMKPSPVLLHHTAFWFSTKSRREMFLLSYVLAPSCLWVSHQIGTNKKKMHLGPFRLFFFNLVSFHSFCVFLSP